MRLALTLSVEVWEPDMDDGLSMGVKLGFRDLTVSVTVSV